MGVFEKEIESFRKEISENVKNMFNETGSVEPILFALTYNQGKFKIGVLMGLERFFISDEGKEAAVLIMRKFNEETKPLAIALATEGWMSIYEKDDNPLDKDGFYAKGKVRPSQDPKRKEVVNISFETYNQKAFECWEIVREENVQLSSMVSQGWELKENEFSGTFMSLLKENYDYISKLVENISLN
jgi:hypothetical protein